MRANTRLERCATVLLIVAIGALVSGTKACQEDYDFASQSNVPANTGTPSDSATATQTVTATGSATVTITPTGTIVQVTGTVTPAETAEPDVTDDPNAGDETTQGASGGGDLFNELSSLGEDKSRIGARDLKNAPSSDKRGGNKGSNWLGEAFTKDTDGAWRDRDGDGFSDNLEEEADSDPKDAGSIPKLEASSRLEDRIRPQEVEQEADRRGDESRFAGEDEVEVDTDVDGIPDEVEIQRGLNPASMDSDQDGIRDDRELVLGTNPLRIDSDSDGISDSREYSAGLDPTIPEGR